MKLLNPIHLGLLLITAGTAWSELPKPLPQMPVGRHAFQAHAHDHKIYLIGSGPDGKSVDIFDTNTHSWTTGSPMPMPIARSWHMGAKLNNSIYIFGGTADRERVKNMVRFDLDRGKWTEVPAPIERTHSMAIAFKEKIYLIGLAAAQAEEVMVFDPKTEGWAPGIPFPQVGPRSATGEHFQLLAVAQGRLHMMGGLNESKHAAFDGTAWQQRKSVHRMSC